jgi:hypothetical protein
MKPVANHQRVAFERSKQYTREQFEAIFNAAPDVMLYSQIIDAIEAGNFILHNALVDGALADLQRVDDGSEAVYMASPEFREDVIAALIEEGCTRAMAIGRTRDRVLLINEAKRLRVI